MLLSGLPLYREAIQQTLREETHRIMEQAKNLDVYALPEGKHCSASNVTEFVADGYKSFKDCIDNLFEMSPTLDCLFENSDSLNMQPGHERTLNAGIASKLYESSSSATHGTLATYPYGGKDLRGDPASAGFNGSHSSGSADFSDVSSVFTGNGNSSSGQPMTDTLTSTSTLHSQEYQRDNEGRTSFGAHQIIMIWNYSRQTEEPHLCLFDSGSVENFITRGPVSKLNLEIERLPNEVTVELLGKVEYQLSEYVKPNWRLQRGQRWRQKHKFFVVDALPNDYHMIIGSTTCNEMGVHFSAKASNLVTFLAGRKGSSKGSSYIPMLQMHACSLTDFFYRP